MAARSSRAWFGLGLVLAWLSGASLGCARGEPEPRFARPLVRRSNSAGAVASADLSGSKARLRLRDDAEALLGRVERLLNLLQGDPQALIDGNWVRAHWLLAFGPEGYRRARNPRAFRRLLASLLEADPAADPEVPFQIRRGKPVARASGKLTNIQYHPDQFLAYLAMAGVPLDAPLIVEGRRFRLRDLLDQSLSEIRPAGELSWTLMAYTEYLAPDHAWRNKFGQELSIEALVVAALAHQEEPCGGSHYDNALARILANSSWSRSPRLQDACSKIRSLLHGRIAVVRAEQRPDGSFRIDAPVPPAFSRADRDVAVVYYTGHTLEWLSIAISERDLQAHWILRSVSALQDALGTERARLSDSSSEPPDAAWRRANIGHAASGLIRWAGRLRSVTVH